MDARAPTLEQLQDGVQWIKHEAESGPVYVHCALGHGRNALFVAAFLLLSGKARTPQEATGQIQKLRPKIGLHPEQVALLEEYSAIRESNTDGE